ncbi:hypothetical protein [Actinophytocola sp.]|uniref:hypothetical protein n=1 Tax=Actinophytocola sp. TaxID=1872138 RepID=UPI003D6C2793
MGDRPFDALLVDLDGVLRRRPLLAGPGSFARGDHLSSVRSSWVSSGRRAS